MVMKRSNIVGLIGLILGIAVVISLLTWFFVKPNPTLLQGQMDATSYKASSKVAGRIEKMHVKEGQIVAQGDLLYEISTPELNAKLAQARGAQAAASAQERKAYTGARSQDIQAARDLWEKAEAGLTLAQKSYDRAKNLYDMGVIPANKYDEATANLQAMKASSSAAKSQYDIALEGARAEDKQAAVGLVQQAAGAVAEVQSYLADAKVYAPVSGEVSSVIAEEGELVGQGFPVVSIIDMGDMWASYNIKETLMPRVRKDDKVTAYVPALDRNVEFYIYYISPQADFATWSATRTQGGFDIRTFNVKMRPVEAVEGLRPGMSTLVNWDKLR